MDADPQELVNLAGDPSHAEVLADMRHSLSAWERDTGDSLPKELSPDEFDRETGEPLPGRVRPRPTRKNLRASVGTSRR